MQAGVEHSVLADSVSRLRHITDAINYSDSHWQSRVTEMCVTATVTVTA